MTVFGTRESSLYIVVPTIHKSYRNMTSGHGTSLRYSTPFVKKNDIYFIFIRNLYLLKVISRIDNIIMSVFFFFYRPKVVAVDRSLFIHRKYLMGRCPTATA